MKVDHWVAHFGYTPVGEWADPPFGAVDLKLGSIEEVLGFISQGVQSVQFVPEQVVTDFPEDLGENGSVTRVEGELHLDEVVKMVPMPGSMFYGHPTNPYVTITPVFANDTLLAALSEDEKAWVQEFTQS